jgi:phage terminase large subunit
MTAFNLCIRHALRRPCVVYYLFPTYAQAKKVIWDSLTNSGVRVLDFIPKEVVESMNSQEMKIRFKNGSLLQLCGSDNYDSLMGTNPSLCVFSEYALQDPRAYQYIRPILTANDGIALFISTPRGKNHLWELYQIALQSPDWFCYKLTVEDTNHIPLYEIEKEKADGIMSDDLIQQEYYTSFDMGVEGSYYSKYLDRMRVKGQIGQVPWESGFKVHTAWDLGVRDSTTILFFQVIGQSVRIVDSYENSKVGLEHYKKVMDQKPYVYGKHIAPHDIKVQEFGSGLTRIEKARQLGINFTVAPDLSIEDGIEATRSALSKIWIDESNKQFLKALENYRQEYDIKRKVYKNHPLHDWSSHWSDALRYLCISLPKTRDGTTPQELDKRYQDAMYGVNSSLPSVFRDDLPQY